MTPTVNKTHICISCDSAIEPTTHGRCPNCDSDSLLPLAKVIEVLGSGAHCSSARSAPKAAPKNTPTEHKLSTHAKWLTASLRLDAEWNSLIERNDFHWDFWFPWDSDENYCPDHPEPGKFVLRMSKGNEPGIELVFDLNFVRARQL